MHLPALTSKFAQMICMTSSRIGLDTIGSIIAGAALCAATSSSSSAPKVTAKMGMADESSAELDPACCCVGWAWGEMGFCDCEESGAVRLSDGGGGSGAE